MKWLKMRENSLFAVLLRSPWWASIAAGAVLFVLARIVFPTELAVSLTLPFVVIASIAGWRQLRAPRASTLAATGEAVRAMSWSEFAGAMEAAWRRQGYAVKRLDGGAADFELTRDARTTLVACRRWKVAQTGVEPLRALQTAREARAADEAVECAYVAIGDLTENARRFGAEHRIRLIGPVELTALLPDVARAGRDAGRERRAA